MSLLDPTPEKVEALRRRWEGQSSRLRAIAADLLAGADWTVHLRGLEFVAEIPALPGEALGRDLRGAPLRRHLRPEVQVIQAAQRDTHVVEAVLARARATETALAEGSPLDPTVPGAEALAEALAGGDVILIAMVAEIPAGVIRLGRRTGPAYVAGHAAYGEVTDLGVRPRYRGHGIASQLLSEAEAILAQMGLDRVLLHAIPEVGLISFYERRGYTVRRTTQRNDAGSAAHLEVLMGKPLRPAALRPARLPSPGSRDALEPLRPPSQRAANRLSGPLNRAIRGSSNKA